MLALYLYEVEHFAKWTCVYYNATLSVLKVKFAYSVLIGASYTNQLVDTLLSYMITLLSNTIICLYPIVRIPPVQAQTNVSFEDRDVNLF
jgi:hypothetical protein